MTVSVITVSYRTGPALFEMIASVLDNRDIDELVIVNHDNPAPIVERLKTLEAEHARLRVVHSGANLGFARGCNLGASVAQGDYFLFLNPDAQIDASAPSILQQTAEGLNPPAIIGGCLLNKDGSLQRGARRAELTLLNAISDVLPFNPGRQFNHHDAPLPEAAEPCATVSGAAMMMSRDSFERLNGFDEAYFLHVEDIDICQRARDLGGQVVFEPRAKIRHVGGTSAASPWVVERHKGAGFVRFFWTHGGQWALLKACLAALLVYPALLGRLILRRLAGSPS